VPALPVVGLAALLALVPITAGAASSPSARSDAASDGLPSAITDQVEGYGDEVSFGEAVELGQLIGRDQGDSLPGDFSYPHSPGRNSPSKALLELAERRDRELTDEQLAKIRALDRLDNPVRRALTDLVDSFAAFEATWQQPSRTASLHTADQATPSGSWNASAVSATRNELLDASADLHDAVSTTDLPARGVASSQCDPIVVSTPDDPIFGDSYGVLAIDLQGCDSIYTRYVALSIDIGGADTYYNNAGGN
jgi:hypothetical protein